ncbi:hypothetical protein [uncultured Dechloromonas sp.]|uniref:hypothetical protein n=1 Tax=uncultured Dechloromonas sp. TaxID=171719 RepID=UPI0025F3DF41|nr:hypothetical protein [uncultured Dechloromonas sp.]
MSLQLSPGPTSLDRLQSAIARMQSKHDFRRLEGDSPEFPDGLAAVLVTDDPQRNLEVLDACVILPEALKPLGEQIFRHVAGPDTAPALMQKYGIARAPAVVFLRDGEFVGSLNGIRDWNEYQSEVARLLSGPAQPKPIGIPVRVAAPGGCV